MNLHGVVSGVVSAVNPQVPATVQVSTGPSATSADGSRSPTFATPGAITASLAAGVMTVSAVSAGKLLKGQTIAGAGVDPGTTILAQNSGTPGGPGDYAVTGSQTLGSQAMTTTLVVPAQVQSLTFRDLQQIEGLNLQGTRRAIYFYGAIEGLVRPTGQGGDLVVLPDGQTWLVAIVLEHWPDWCKVAATLQNA